MNNNKLKGISLVAFGAISYGMLATFVKLAYKEGYTTAEVTTAQFVYGIIGLLLLQLVFKRNSQKATAKPSKKNITQLIIAGSSIGFTSVFYYLCVKYINVSIAIVLLMQTVWMGVFLEWILEKKKPSAQKISAVIIVIIGTLLATNLLNNKVEIDWKGLTFGLLAAASFTTTMFTANRIALGVSTTNRSLYMLLGGASIVGFFALLSQDTAFNLHIFEKWGIVLALFGTIIPPLLMNAGFPITGLGLGSIISALELPVSVIMAFSFLNESVIFSQWVGITLIIAAIALLNVKINKK